MARKKGSPPRLGKPDRGVARYLTLGESDATGLTRNCIIFNSTAYEDLMVLIRTSDGWKEMIEDYDWLIGQLEKFWSGEE